MLELHRAPLVGVAPELDLVLGLLHLGDHLLEPAGQAVDHGGVERHLAERGEELLLLEPHGEVGLLPLGLARLVLPLLPLEGLHLAEEPLHRREAGQHAADERGLLLLGVVLVGDVGDVPDRDARLAEPVLQRLELALGEVRRHHGPRDPFLALLDPLGERDLALAREERDAAHLAEVHPDRVLGAADGARREIDRVAGLGLDGLLPLVEGVFDLVQGAGRLGAVDDVDVHGSEHQHDVVELVRGDQVSGQGVVELFVGDVALLLARRDQLVQLFQFRVVAHGRASSVVGFGRTRSHGLPPASARIRGVSWPMAVWSELKSVVAPLASDRATVCEISRTRRWACRRSSRRRRRATSSGEVGPLPLLDEPPGEERAGDLVRQPLEERVRRQGRLVPERRQDGPGRGVDDAGGVDQRQQRLARLRDLEHQLAEVPFEPRHVLGWRDRRACGPAAGRTCLGETLGLEPEIARVDAEPPGRFASELDRLVAVLHLREHEGDAGAAGGAAPRARRVLLGEHTVEREEEEGPGGAAGRLEGLAAFGPEERVGVVAGRERRDPEPEAPPRERVRAPGQRPPLGIGRALEQILGAPRRFLPRPVGVEEEDRLVGIAAKEPQLGRRERGPEDGHGLPEAVLVRHQAVDVALDQERSAILGHALPRAVQARRASAPSGRAASRAS